MSQSDHTLAQQAYYWAIKAVEAEIEKLSETHWYDLCLPGKPKPRESDRIIVLKELEKRFRKHREGLGTRKGK